MVDQERGRRLLETLQPTSERERVLLFARDRSLRDPISGDPRPWLTRFDRWLETTHIGPDVDAGARLPGVDGVLSDVRVHDPEWAQTGRTVAFHSVPAVFETDDELWIEACPPSSTELARALHLLRTALGEQGWYWLSGCAVYPEINYDLTVALGRLLRDDDDEPVAAHVDIAQLTELPWFRHAYMPDWLRATLISAMSRAQLVEARGALNEILVRGVVSPAGARGGQQVAEFGMGIATTVRDAIGGHAVPGDRVYLDSMTLRRRRLATSAPRQLVAAVRRHRHRSTSRAADAPSERVRRALARCNALLFIAALLAPVTIAGPIVGVISTGDWDALSDFWGGSSSAWRTMAEVGGALVLAPAIIALVYSPLAGRRRGVVTGGVALMYLPALTIALPVIGSDNPAIAHLALLGVFGTALAVTVAALLKANKRAPRPRPRFQRRNRITFTLALGMTCLATFTWWAIQSQLILGPSSPAVDSVRLGLIQALFVSGVIVLAAAYFAGVRFIPLLAGGTILVFTVSFIIEASDLLPTTLLGLAAAVVVACFYWQMTRVRVRPPLEFGRRHGATGSGR